MKIGAYGLQGLAILLLIATLGCATYPPPSIQNGYYINPKYAFSVKVPEGWVEVDQIPDSFAKTWPTNPGNIKTMFFDKDTNGLIGFAGQKMKLRGYAYAYYQIADENIHKTLREREDNFKKYPNVRYFYEQPRDGRWSEEIYFETVYEKRKVITEGNTYSHKGHFYITEIWLASDVGTFDLNYKIYQEVVESFQLGNLMYRGEPSEK